MSETAVETPGLPPINLHANSYNLQDLEKASRHAEGLKTDKGTGDALMKIADDLAANKEVLAHQRGVAVPEHHEIATVQDASGREVRAAVYVPTPEAEADAEEAEQQVEAQTETVTSRRRGQADTSEAAPDKAS